MERLNVIKHVRGTRVCAESHSDCQSRDRSQLQAPHGEKASALPPGPKSCRQLQQAAPYVSVCVCVCVR